MKTVSAFVLALALIGPSGQASADDNFSDMIRGLSSGDSRPAQKVQQVQKKRTQKRRTVNKPVYKPAPAQVVAKPEAQSKKKPAVEVKAKPEAQTKAKPVAQATPEPKQEAKIKKIQMTEAEAAARIEGFSHIKNNGKIAEEPFKKALAFYSMNRHKTSNTRYLGVIDFQKNSSQKRFCLIDMRSGDVDCMKTSHGIGSDGGRGRAVRFSNRDKSHMSSLGFYKTLGEYYGKHGLALNLDGLSETNKNAFSRRIVIHAADYVSDSHNGISGRSHGCPALDPRKTQSVIQKIKGGALIYAWHGDFF
jgi:hypothetical protein